MAGIGLACYTHQARSARQVDCDLTEQGLSAEFDQSLTSRKNCTPWRLLPDPVNALMVTRLEKNAK